MIHSPNRVAVTLLGMAAMAVAAQTVVAQPRAGRGFGASSLRLATLEVVQDELKMTDEQTTEVAKINDQLRADRRGLFDRASGDYGAIQDDLAKLRADAAAELSAALDKTQLQRLAGIAIHVSGPTALNDPIVASQLSLSDESEAKLKQVRTANLQTMREWGAAGDLSREERRAQLTELAEAAGKKLLAVLSAEEKARFEQLKGEAIEIDMLQLRGRRGRSAE